MTLLLSFMEIVLYGDDIVLTRYCDWVKMLFHIKAKDFLQRMQSHMGCKYLGPVATIGIHKGYPLRLDDACRWIITYMRIHFKQNTNWRLDSDFSWTI